MSIKIGGYDFEGPFTDTFKLRYEQGVYSILDQRAGGQYFVVDIGESEDVRTRIENHDRGDCWKRNQRGTLTVAVLYTPGMSGDRRRAIESALRAQYSPACGVR